MKNRNSLGAKSSRFILKGVGLWSNKDVMEYAYSVLILVHGIHLRIYYHVTSTVEVQLFKIRIDICALR